MSHDRTLVSLKRLNCLFKHKESHKQLFAETLRLPGPWMHQALHGPFVTPQTCQDGPWGRLLRQQTTQG